MSRDSIKIILSAFAVFILCFLNLPTAKAGLILNHPNYWELTKGLVGYWSFDGKDMAGTVAYDRSGKGNDGTLTNGPLKVKGKIGQALKFDGVNDWVEIPNTVVGGRANGTVSAWVKFNSTNFNSTATSIFHHGEPPSSDGENLILGASPADAGSNNIVFGLYNGSWDFANSGFVPSTGVWYHYVGTWGSNGIQIYVDGTLRDTNSSTEADDGGASTSLIGASSREPNGSIDGLIDDVRIYNRALSPDEIKRLYRIGGTVHVNTTISNDSLTRGLVGHWTFDGPDMNATKALDISGQGNDGTLTNGPTRTKGKLGQALKFDGSDDVVDAGNASSLNNLNPFTYTAWIYPRSGGEGTSGNIFNKFVGGNAKTCRFRNGENGALDFLVARVSDANALTVTDVIKFNQWNFVACRYSSSDGPRVYVGTANNFSEADYSSRTVGSGAEGDDSGSALTIGNNTSLDQTFDGLIDEVRIYNRALTADEIKRLYRIGGTLHVNTTISNDSLTRGLVGYWSFDGKDMAGTVAYDRSGKGNDGTLTNGPLKVKGKLGQALKFDGVNDYVSLLTPFNNSQYSFSLWVMGDNAPSANLIEQPLSNGATSIDSFSFAWSHTDATFRQAVVHQDTGNTYTAAKFTTTLKGKTWYHVVGTYDGVNLRAYLNGALEATTPSNTLITPAGEFRIGGLDDAVDNDEFPGLIDDVRVYNRALTPDEIKRLYIIGGGR